MRFPTTRCARLAALATVIVLTSCAVNSNANGTRSPSSVIAPSAGALIDCESLINQKPTRVAEDLVEAGYSVVWRQVHTDADGVPVADIVATAPPGAIVDIILDGEKALVFVADPGDPTLVSPPPPTC